jgi:hypothetical protein
MTDLGTLGGDSTGLALDDSGVVVGSYYDLATRSRRTFIHVEGTMHDLEGLVVAGLDGATLFEATGINSRGQIVANGCRQTVCLAYLLNPLAPASVSVDAAWALALAAAVLAWYAGRSLGARRAA